MSPQPYTIDLLRHGPVAGEPALYGTTDVALAQGAIEMMHDQLKRYPVNYSQLVSSPRLRCKAFAEEYATRHHLPVRFDANCQEYDFGELDGIAFDEMDQAQRQQLSLFWQYPAKTQLPAAEDYQGFEQRVSEFWHALTHIVAHQGNALVVTHGGVITTLVAQLMGVPLSTAFERVKISHASLTRICFYDKPEQAQLQFIGVPAR